MAGIKGRSQKEDPVFRRRRPVSRREPTSGPLVLPAVAVLLALPTLVFGWTAQGSNSGDVDTAQDGDISAEALVTAVTDPTEPQGDYSVASGHARASNTGNENAPGATTEGEATVDCAYALAGWTDGDWHPSADPGNEETWQQSWGCTANILAQETSGGGSVVEPSTTIFLGDYTITLSDMTVAVEGIDVTPSTGWQAEWSSEDHLEQTDSLPHSPAEDLENNFTKVVVTEDGKGPDLEVCCWFEVVSSWEGANETSPPAQPPIFHQLVGGSPAPSGYGNAAFLNVGYNVKAKQPSPIIE